MKIINKVSNKGITLVALVITIVVLIILTSVAIGQLTKNGIIGKADEAKVKTNQQTAMEQMNFKISSIQMSGYAESNSLPSLQYLADKLCEDDDMQYVEKTSKATASLSPIDVSGCESIFTKLKAYPYEFEINSSLQLASINGVDLIASNTDAGSSKPLDTNTTGLWNVWLSLAGVDYTKYTEKTVLEDSNLMDIVMNNEKAVDYLVQSPTFLYPAVARSQVAMTALKNSEYALNKCIDLGLLAPSSLINNTNKNYTATAQYQYNDTTYNVSNLFDNNINTYWASTDCWNWSGDQVNCYIKVNFNKPQLLKQFTYNQAKFSNEACTYSYYSFATIKLYGIADDGSKVLLGSNDNPIKDNYTLQSMDLSSNNTTYTNYEIDLTRNGSYGIAMSAVDFLGY